MWQQYLQEIKEGNIKTLSRTISLIENEVPGYDVLLKLLPATAVPVIGITGPPGAGKSTLTDGLIAETIKAGKRVGVLCVDPSSPFNLGAILGDRVRMSNWYTHDSVYIRSLASRGSMGGLNPRIIEITDLMKTFPLDYIIVETVGVGQSEIEIAGLADVTTVVLVPEGGDEIQTMKAGLMEIADIFVVNKSDRPDSDAFVSNLRMMLAPAFNKKSREVPVLKTVASSGAGMAELMQQISSILDEGHTNERKLWLLAEKAYQLIQSKRMHDVNKDRLKREIEERIVRPDFNLYKYISEK